MECPFKNHGAGNNHGADNPTVERPALLAFKDRPIADLAEFSAALPAEFFNPSPDPEIRKKFHLNRARAEAAGLTEAWKNNGSKLLDQLREVKIPQPTHQERYDLLQNPNTNKLQVNADFKAVDLLSYCWLGKSMSQNSWMNISTINTAYGELIGIGFLNFLSVLYATPKAFKQQFDKEISASEYESSMRNSHKYFLKMMSLEKQNNHINWCIANTAETTYQDFKSALMDARSLISSQAENSQTLNPEVLVKPKEFFIAAEDLAHEYEKERSVCLTAAHTIGFSFNSKKNLYEINPSQELNVIIAAFKAIGLQNEVLSKPEIRLGCPMLIVKNDQGELFIDKLVDAWCDIYRPFFKLFESAT